LSAWRLTEREGAQQSYLVPISDALGILAGPAGAFALSSSSASGPGITMLSSQAGQNITVEEKEPNDFGSEANVAPLGATIRGTLGSENEDAVELLRFDNPDEEPGKVRAIVRLVKALNSGNLIMLNTSVYDANEEELASDKIDLAGSFSKELPPSQSYVVKVFPYSPVLGKDWSILYEVILRGLI
jgi:hypothetical protein